MENAIVFKFSEGDINHLQEEAERTSNSDVSKSKNRETDSNFLKKEVEYSLEDSKEVLANVFSGRDRIYDEKWLLSENVQSRIVSVSDSEVTVDCLIDISNRLFQHRVFPRRLFDNVKKLDKGGFVLIKTKAKPGAIRIDVYPGNGIVNEKFFHLKDGWESLENEKLDEKLTQW